MVPKVQHWVSKGLSPPLFPLPAWPVNRSRRPLPQRRHVLAIAVKMPHLEVAGRGQVAEALSKPTDAGSIRRRRPFEIGDAENSRVPAMRQ